MGAWRAAALATEFGFSVVGSLVGGVLLGQFLDRHFGTAPFLFLAGLFGGLLFSIYLIYVIYRIQIQPRGRTVAGTSSRPTAAASVPAESDSLVDAASTDTDPSVRTHAPEE